MTKLKTDRVRAAAAQGFRDVAGPELEMRTNMVAGIMETYRRWGFAPLETPAIERAECLGSFLPDEDRPNAGVFTWTNDEEGSSVALRYDLTAPLARYVAENQNELPLPFRRSAAGPVWRNEKTAPGRFRQFWQCDADLVGAPSIGADAEICAMLSEALLSTGLSSQEVTLRISNRKILDGVLEQAGVDMLDDRARLTAIRAIDKLDRLGQSGVRDLLGAGRRDASGAYTSGAKLTDSQADIIMAFLQAQVADLPDLVGNSRAGNDGLRELDTVLDLAQAMGIALPLRFDPSIVRGLGYYTGTVVEADLTFEVLDERGNPRRFGSVAGGGRYDGLLARFTGQDVPSVGASIGVDRLTSALLSRPAQTCAKRRSRPILVTVMDREAMGSYQAIAASLRAAGLNAQVYYGNPKKFGSQLKYADQIDACLAIIQGSNERAAGQVTIKDLDLGRQIATTSSLADWASKPQQREVPMEAMVSEIERMLT